MASEVPERIWAWGNNKIAWWHDKPEYGATEYVRADLAVPATTHQRTLEALREVIAATSAYLPPDGISAQECLNRILAATDNPDIKTIMGVGNGRS